MSDKVVGKIFVTSWKNYKKFRDNENNRNLDERHVANFAMLEFMHPPFPERNTHRRVMLLARLLDSELINWRCSFDIVNYTNARSCRLWGGSIFTE